MDDRLAELRHLISRHASGRAMTTPLDGVLLMASDAPTQPLSGVAEPALAFVAQGTKCTALCGRTFTYGPGQFLVVSVDLPLTAHVERASRDAPFLGVGLKLKPATITALLLEAGAARPGDEIEAPAIAVSDTPAELVDALVRLLRLLDRPEDAPILGPMLEREIVWRLINGEQGALVRQIGIADSRLAQIARAIQRIRTGFSEELRVGELARLAGMSVTSFHRHFRAITAMSPLQYQKQIRLQAARVRILSEPGAVAAVGFAVGYESPSQFSREYRRLFGVSPGKDAARRA